MHICLYKARFYTVFCRNNECVIKISTPAQHNEYFNYLCMHYKNTVLFFNFAINNCSKWLPFYNDIFKFTLYSTIDLQVASSTTSPSDFKENNAPFLSINLFSNKTKKQFNCWKDFMKLVAVQCFERVDKKDLQRCFEC